MPSPRIAAAALAAALAPAPFASPPPALGADPAAAVLLARARQNHYTGDFTAAVLCVRESFLAGRDTLRGTLEVRDASGGRRLALRGANGSFEWWSRLEGREQWRREGTSGRLRRLPPHSLKKPAFAPDVSFEDLARLPFGHLEGFRAARRAGETDTTYALELVPDAGSSALYSALAVTLGRDPVVLRRLVFTADGARPSRSMEIARYAAEPDGLFPVEIVFAGGDGLSSVRLFLTPLHGDPARDKAQAAEEPPPGFAEPRWLPRDGGADGGEREQ